VETIYLGDRKISIRTSVLEEKATACNMLCCYADELKDGFYPWVEQARAWPAIAAFDTQCSHTPLTDCCKVSATRLSDRFSQGVSASYQVYPLSMTSACPAHAVTTLFMQAIALSLLVTGPAPWRR
jgi:hypothetical protein